ARSANFVGGPGGGGCGQAAGPRCLARGVLAESRGYDQTHDAFIDLSRIDLGATDRFPHGDCPELWRRQSFQRSLKLADRGTYAAHDDHVLHTISLCDPNLSL